MITLYYQKKTVVVIMQIYLQNYKNWAKAKEKIKSITIIIVELTKRVVKTACFMGDFIKVTIEVVII